MSHTSLVPGKTDGVAVPAGYVGERILSSSVEISGTSSAGATTATLPLTAGVWQIFVNTTMINASGTITWARQCSVLTTNNALNPGLGAFYSTDLEANRGATGGTANISNANEIAQSWANSTILNISSATTYYYRTAYTVNGGGSVGIRNIAYAIRIA